MGCPSSRTASTTSTANPSSRASRRTSSTSPVRPRPNPWSYPSTSSPIPYRARSTCRTNSSGARRASSPVNGSSSIRSSPSSASSARFSSGSVSSRGAAGGFTTSSGCRSKVTIRLASPRVRARRTISASTARWPRCTPSNVPTVATVPVIRPPPRRAASAAHPRARPRRPDGRLRTAPPFPLPLSPQTRAVRESPRPAPPHPAPDAAAQPPAWRDLAGDRSSAPPAPPRRRAETDLPECARAPRGARHTATPPPRRARGCGGRCRRSRWRGTARPAAPGPPARGSAPPPAGAPGSRPHRAGHADTPVRRRPAPPSRRAAAAGRRRETAPAPPPPAPGRATATRPRSWPSGPWRRRSTWCAPAGSRPRTPWPSRRRRPPDGSRGPRRRPTAPPRTGRACRGVRPAAWRARDAPDRPRRETWVLRASRRAPRRRSARALLDLLEHGVDPLGVLDAAIELEAQLGAGAQAQLAGQLGAQEPRGTAETLERLRLFLLAPHYAHPDAGVRQVAGDLDCRDRDESDAGVPHVAGEELRHRLADQLGHALGAVTRSSHHFTRSSCSCPRCGRPTPRPPAGRFPEHAFRVAPLVRHHAGRQLGALPQVLVRRLGRRDVEPVMQPVLEALEHVALVLERAAPLEVQLPGDEPHDHGSPASGRASHVQRARDFLDLVRLDQVADLDVVEALDPDAALEALPDLAHVVLEALEGADAAFVHLHAVADHAHPRGAGDDAGADEAPRDRSHLRDLERLPHLRLAQHDFLLLGGEQALHRRFHLLHRLVDDAVGANLHALALRGGAGVRVGPHVEADDDGARGLRQQDVGVGDGADAPVHDLHLHLRCGELGERVGERFRRAALVGFDDDTQRRGAAGRALGHEVLERLHAAGAAVLRLALEALPLLRDLARRSGVRHHTEGVARFGHALEA